MSGATPARRIALGVMLLAAACDANTDTASTASTRAATAATAQPRTTTAQPRTTTASTREPCRVAAVSDGDSFRCAAQGRIRLLLIDAPESDQEPFGTRSRDALRQRLIRGDTVWLEFDVQRADRYGRTLAHVWTAPMGGTHVNLAHARDGWAVAVVFPPNVRHVEAIRAAVAEARRTRRGLWADGRFTCEPIDHKRGNC